MALIEEMNSQGNWLFKYRGQLPLVIVGVGLLFFITSKLETHEPTNRFVIFIYLAISLLGQFIRIMTVGFTPKGTSGRNTQAQVAEDLNTSGIYSTCRHPLYLGNFFMWLGIVLVMQNWWFSVIFILVYWLYYERIMFAEEFYLRKKFGEKYIEWSLKTPAFIPALGKFTKSKLNFSIRNVLKREYNGFFATMLLFTLLKLIDNYLVLSDIYLEIEWIIIFCFSLILFLTLRTLKKSTKILDVDGR